jgi:hypothetical protein
MTTFNEIVPDDYNHRLIKGEGQIFALTQMVRELLSLYDPEAVNDRVIVLRNTIAPDESDDECLRMFRQSAWELFDQFISGSPPTRPTFPTLTSIKGGKT